MNIKELRRLAEHLIQPYVCQGCGKRFEQHPGQRDRDWKRGCPECGGRIDIPYAGGDSGQSQVDASKLRSLLTPTAVKAIIDVVEAAQLWRQCHSPGASISEQGLAKALANLEKMP